MKLENVVAHFGNQTELAKALRIKPQAVYQWTEIPLLRQYQIEKITNGKFKAKQ